MIYTVTLNPSLDYLVEVPKFQTGLTNRTVSEKIVPGGKGLNVSMILSRLGVKNTAYGFVAGFTGEEIAKRTQECGINAEYISVEEGFSRINVKLLSIDGTEINGQGPKIGIQELDLLMKKLEDLKRGDILILAGSVPSCVPEDIYSQIMGTLKDRGIHFVVDATGERLTSALKYHPFFVKPNHHELGEIFDTAIRSREEAIVYAKKLKEMGAENVLVSLAGKGAVLVAQDGQIISEDAPNGELINAVGAGDSMVAGFVAGWQEKQDYRYAFYTALAAGSASAFSKDLATGEEIKKLRTCLL